MAAMADSIGKGKDAAKYEKMAEEAKAYLRGEFFASEDGMIVPVLRGMQTPALFALKLGLVKSAWRYEGETWVWDFAVPEGVTADVTIPGEHGSRRYGAGRHRIVK